MKERYNRNIHNKENGNVIKVIGICILIVVAMSHVPDLLIK